jgi:hypothetical protein
MENANDEHPHTHVKKEHPKPKPYWQRAHLDWKLWVAVLIMLAAMAVYLRSNDLSHGPGKVVPQQPVP